MIIIYIPYKKKKFVYFTISIAVIVLMLFIFYNTNSKDVFNIISIPQPIYKGDENIPKVSFACNVVWGAEYVPKMLDLFREKDIKITFFIGGEWASENADLLRQMVMEGHELGNHGYYHKHHSQLNFDENRREISQTEDIIYKITGVKTVLFAPPYGEFNDTTLKAADSLGYKTIMWSIDTIDWRREGAEVIANRVLKKPHNGAIILMHPVEDTLEALPIIIDQLRERGFEIGKVSDVLP